MNVIAVDGHSGGRSKDREDEIDLTLAVLCCLFPGHKLTYRQIAEMTGMSHGGPYVVEQRALKKLRKWLRYTSARSLGAEVQS